MFINKVTVSGSMDHICQFKKGQVHSYYNNSNDDSDNDKERESENRRQCDQVVIDPQMVRLSDFQEHR